MRLELGAVDFGSRLQGSELASDRRQCDPVISSDPRSSRSSHVRGEEAVKLEWHRRRSGMMGVGAEDGSC